MNGKKFLLLSLIISASIITGIVIGRQQITDLRFATQRMATNVLGDISDTIPLVTPQPSVIPTEIKNSITSTPKSQGFTTLGTTQPQYTVSVIQAPKEISEGVAANFTWHVNGPTKTIHNTTIYLGTKSYGGTLTKSVSPGLTPYTYTIPDFTKGDYIIPLQFIAGVTLNPDIYFYRAYALIDGKHYWSPEGKLTINKTPIHEIKIISKPDLVKTGESAAFTWDISGPAGTTGFTAIVGGRESKPGIFDAQVNLQMTPYSVLVNDFTNGTYNVPLRFIGNTVIGEPGTYYIRALTFINNKNIWSEEYSFVVAP